MKEYKNKIILIGGLLIFTILIMIFNHFIKKNNDYKIEKKSLELIGREVYNDYLYKEKYDLLQLSITENKKIKISIIDIIYMIDDVDFNALKKSKLFSECNLVNSEISYTIYEPISETNYDMKVELDCK